MQIIIGLIVVVFFILKLIWQKTKKQINNSEFIFWLIFWLITGSLILFLKPIDKLVADLGFSGSGIQVLLYLAVAILFYLVFKTSLRLDKIDNNLTKITRELAIKDKDK